MIGAAPIPDPDPAELFHGLPCGDEILTGLSDLKAGRVTVQACLAAMASPRLKNAGLLDEIMQVGKPDSEHTLYHLLGEVHEDPYAPYQAKLRELVSFENSLDHRLRWQAGLPA